TVATLPAFACETNSEYGIAADEGFPEPANRITFQPIRTPRKISHISHRGNGGRPWPVAASDSAPGRGGTGGRSRAGGVTGPLNPGPGRGSSDVPAGRADPPPLPVIRPSPPPAPPRPPS